MRIPRVFVTQALSSGCTIELSGQEAHYLANVLRMDAGRELVLFCNDGAEYSARIETSSKKNVAIEILEKYQCNRESPLHTHLAIGVSKGERMDWVLQKACELGVTSITPLFTERTEVRLKGERLDKKQTHWHSILTSSCEQCQRNTLPQLHTAQNYSEFLQNNDAELKLVLHHRSSHTLHTLSEQFKSTPPQQVCLLIGPEGGLSDNEIDQALGQQFTPLTLGPRVLRTETAPVAILSCLQMLWGDF